MTKGGPERHYNKNIYSRLEALCRSYQVSVVKAEGLESIKNATIPGGYEVIVVNDGGPEEINRIAEQFKSTMPLTCIRNTENKGGGIFQK